VRRPTTYEWVRRGATGWVFDTIKAYLRKMERHVLHGEHPDTTHEYRGDEGRVQTGVQLPQGESHPRAAALRPD
jgi:hypothetical protein